MRGERSFIMYSLGTNLTTCAAEWICFPLSKVGEEFWSWSLFLAPPPQLPVHVQSLWQGIQTLKICWRSILTYTLATSHINAWSVTMVSQLDALCGSMRSSMLIRYIWNIYMYNFFSQRCIFRLMLEEKLFYHTSHIYTLDPACEFMCFLSVHSFRNPISHMSQIVTHNCTLFEFTWTSY